MVNNTNTKLLCFLFLSVSFVFSIMLEFNSTSSFIATISYFLLFIMVLFNYVLISNIINPLFFFSIMYSGYIVGGFYYSQSNGYFGKFIEFIDMSREQAEWYLIIALFYAIVCYVFFAVGYVILNKNVKFNIRNEKFACFFGARYHYLSYPFLILGFIYWIWVSNTIAGGVYNSLVLFQVFPHLVKQHDISIVPYLFYYSGIYLWLIGIISSNGKLTKSFVFCSLIGFIICMSTARISMSVTYILVQLVMIYLSIEHYRKRIIIVALVLLSSAFVFHMLREISNYYFLHNNTNGFNLNLLKTIIGGGNVSDLQQLVIVFYSFDLNNTLLGTSYLDWLINFAGVYLGMKPESIGLLIHELYIPSTSGAPTPGAIGEAFANFSFGAPIFMFLIGSLFAIIHTMSMKSSNSIILFIYSSFLVCFVFLFPKVDSTMLVNFIWGTLPTICFLSIYYIVFLMVDKQTYK